MTARLTGDFFDGEVVELWVGPNIVEAFWRRRTGASRQTLERRLTYGGRKARSAARRLADGELWWRAIVHHCKHQYALELPTESRGTSHE